MNTDDLSTEWMRPVRTRSSPACRSMSTEAARPTTMWPCRAAVRIRIANTPACRLAGTRPSQTSKVPPATKTSRAGPHAGVCSRSMAMSSSRGMLRTGTRTTQASPMCDNCSASTVTARLLRPAPFAGYLVPTVTTTEPRHTRELWAELAGAPVEFCPPGRPPRPGTCSPLTRGCPSRCARSLLAGLREGCAQQLAHRPAGHPQRFRTCGSCSRPVAACRRGRSGRSNRTARAGVRPRSADERDPVAQGGPAAGRIPLRPAHAAPGGTVSR